MLSSRVCASRCAGRWIGAVAVMALLATAAASAQTGAGQTGSVEGTVSTQNGSATLPGVVITILGASNQPLAQQVSDDGGRFVVSGLPAGVYHVRAELDGFNPLEREAVVAAGGIASVSLDLAINAVSEHVDVVASAPVFEAATLATSEGVPASDAQLLVPGQGVQSSLRLITGVIQVPGGDSIDGGRPYQAGMQLGAATLINPATNIARLSLPSDAIESVSVLPNPYEVEFGRFSSGLVVVQTRRGGDRWKTTFDNLEPALRLKRFTVVQVTGITVWQPSLEVSGPLVRGRMFLDQAVQYRYQTTDIPSRPETELKTNQMFSSLTRVDTTVSPRHSLVMSAGFVPSATHQATLGTFVPPDATVDVDEGVAHARAMERALLGAGTEVESTLEFHRYHVGVEGQGAAPMTLRPETTLGNFFNVQHRHAQALQWVETASHAYKGAGGEHLFKVGFDLLHSGYEGTSASAPVLIERSNGTLARRLDFDGTSRQSVHGVDAAAFVQDRIQPAPRMYLEVGARVDRDGVTGGTNFTPRAGAGVRINDSGTATLHGGYGVFYERTPSVAGAFEQFERSIDTRFEADGISPIGAPIPYVNVTAPGLEAASSTTWDVAIDDRVNRVMSIHAGVLDREGRHALIVEPVRSGQGGQYVMSSTGQSKYVQEEIEVQAGHGTRGNVNASFVHSSAHEDLNSLLTFVDDVLQPIVAANAYAPAMADAPNRFLLRGRVMVAPGWQVLGTVDWRSGLPYSVVNEDLEFVGPRNELRFPSYFRVDAGFDRRLSIKGIHPWMGIRVANALNSFLPSDVQANLDSPAFGSFYNSVYREYRIAVRFEK